MRTDLGCIRFMPDYGHKQFLAFDLGAESGRAVLAGVRSGMIRILSLLQIR